MWTTTITKIADEGDSKRITFTFDNGEKTVERTDSGFRSDEQIKRYAYNQVQTLDEVITLNEGDVLDLTPPVPTPPTQEQLDAQAYQQMRASLIQLKQDVELGLADQATFNASLAEVTSVKETLTATKG